ncbi:MAG: C-GCAxxG-C-C family protein [Bacteroidales bacterium]|nr:C-GCAxxG-C-C family protein [Bacteroidales bacterium]
METRKDIAAQKKLSGTHNCTQAVSCTYCDYAGMDEETMRHIGNAFAAGMGNMEGTCGAIVGAGVVLGLTTRDKAKSMRGMRQIMERFKARNQTTQCKLLKGVGSGQVLRECHDCVADACEFLEELLPEQNKD